MNITPQAQISILQYSVDTIGLLECLLSVSHRSNSRSDEEKKEYATQIVSSDLYTAADICGLYGLYEFKITDTQLKSCVVAWMQKHTDHAASALSMACLAKRAAKHIYNGVLAFYEFQGAIHPNLTKPRMDFPVALKQVLRDTRYAQLFGMLYEAYQLTHTDQKVATAKKIDQGGKNFNPIQPIGNITPNGYVSIFNVTPELMARNSRPITNADLITYSAFLSAKKNEKKKIRQKPKESRKRNRKRKKKKKSPIMQSRNRIWMTKNNRTMKQRIRRKK